MNILKRKQYLVKPKLQLKYVALCGITILIAAVLIYYSFLKSLLTAPGMEQVSAGTIQNFIRTYNTGFFWTTIIFAAIALVGSLLYFHRLIGPLYFFEKVTKKFENGDFTMQIHHRRKDQTIELATNMGNFINNLKQTIKEDRNKIELINKAIDSNDTQRAKKLLKELTQWFKIEDIQQK